MIFFKLIEIFCNTLLSTLSVLKSKHALTYQKPKRTKRKSRVSTKDYFRNCEVRTEEPIVGEIHGHIPTWLEGTLIRNGAGIMNVGPDSYSHLFDGMAVLHRYHIKDGKVSYCSRALESDTYKRNMEANRIVVSEFGTAIFPDPCKTIFQKLQSTFEALQGKNLSDNCSVNIGYYGDQLYAMTETNAIRRINPEDLKVMGNKTIISDHVAVNHASAHPHVNEDGTVYNMGNHYASIRGGHYVVAKIPPTFGSQETCFQGGEIVAKIPFSNQRFPAYYHTFGMTRDRIIFIESPWRIDLLKIMKAQFWSQKPLLSTMVWKDSFKTRFHVVSLLDGKIHPVIYEAEPFFAFHHINTYEEEGQIVVDVAAYDSGDILSALVSGSENRDGGKSNEASVRRFVLPLDIKHGQIGENLVTIQNCHAKAFLQVERDKVFCESQKLTQVWMELPRINYGFNGRKYRYFYALTNTREVIENPSLDPEALAKVDVETNEILRWYEKDKIPSEPVFVRNPNSLGKEEDDGVILSALLNQNKENSSTLLILDAKNMKEIGRVGFETLGTFTATLHGMWMNAGDPLHFY